QVGYRCGDREGAATLELTARLVREIDITPASLVLSGGAPPPGQISISFHHPAGDPRWKDFLFREVKTSSPRLTANAIISSDGGGVRPGDAVLVWSCGVTVSVAPDCPEGQFAETVTITTNHPDYPEIKVPVTIVREPKRRVTALPARLTLVAGG